MSASTHSVQMTVLDPPVAGVIDECVLLDVGPGNWSKIHCKTKIAYLLSYLTNPVYSVEVV